MSDLIAKCCQELSLNFEQLKEIRDALYERIKIGFSCDGQEILGLPAYLPKPPATLTGTALVIDVGGTNMRAALVNYQDGKATIIGEPVQGQVETGRDISISAEEFFDSQAKLASQLNPAPGTPVGYCFSYPATITPEADAILLAWTKGICIPGVVGTSVGLGLKRALEAQGLKPGRIAVLNDTVATLLAGAAIFGKDNDQFIGMVAGTGINMAGYLPVSSITKMNNSTYRFEEIAINLEAGNFKPPYATRWDDILDENSNNIGRQRFEKATSGYYMPFLYKAIADDIGLDIGQFDPMQGTGELVRLSLEENDRLASAILKRSGLLIAASIAGFMKAIGSKGKFSIAIEGSRYWKDPTQSRLVPSTVRSLCEEGQEFSIDGVANANFAGAACAVLSL